MPCCCCNDFLWNQGDPRNVEWCLLQMIPTHQTVQEELAAVVKVTPVPVVEVALVPAVKVTPVPVVKATLVV
jgi:hypothetical protein